MVSWHAWVSIAFLFYKHGWECMLASDEDTVHGALAWYCDAVDEYVISKSSCPLAGMENLSRHARRCISRICQLTSFQHKRTQSKHELLPLLLEIVIAGISHKLERYVYSSVFNDQMDIHDLVYLSGTRTSVYNQQ